MSPDQHHDVESRVVHAVTTHSACGAFRRIASRGSHGVPAHPSLPDDPHGLNVCEFFPHGLQM